MQETEEKCSKLVILLVFHKEAFGASRCAPGRTVATMTSSTKAGLHLMETGSFLGHGYQAHRGCSRDSPAGQEVQAQGLEWEEEG